MAHEDTEEEGVIAFFPMNGISVAGIGDGQEETLVTVVAKDGKMRGCHVFDCEDAADEAITTIGQAFTLAAVWYHSTGLKNFIMRALLRLSFAVFRWQELAEAARLGRESERIAKLMARAKKSSHEYAMGKAEAESDYSMATYDVARSGVGCECGWWSVFSLAGSPFTMCGVDLNVFL